MADSTVCAPRGWHACAGPSDLVIISNTPTTTLRSWLYMSALLAFHCSGCWTLVGLVGPAPWQTPQSARREDGGEESDHADRKQRPDEKEVSAEIGNLAGDADTLPLHVDVGYGQRKERQEKH